jgi:GH25 family lysozyme M1 (1,4-beta-N-acetylmuramidase)
MKELCFDISTWQGGINYQEIRNKTNYVILRGGFSTTKDNQFENHYNNLQGLNLGVYWYSYAKNEAQARNEARKCLEVINGKKFTLPIYLDLEDPSISGLGRGTLDNIVRAFGEVITNGGYYFGVYTNLNWYRNKISGNELNKKYDWWIACWGDNPPSPSYNINYGVWQFTSNYNVGGKRVDANYIFKDYPTIIREAGLNHLDPTPVPPTPPQPTPTHKIAEDGYWGVDTTKKAQEVFGTIVDGKVSNQYAYYKNQNPGLLSSTFEWVQNPKGSSNLIYAIQKWCGVYADGYIGTETIKAMQRKLGTGVDGKVSSPSAMVKAFQHWLNEQ